MASVVAAEGGAVASSSSQVNAGAHLVFLPEHGAPRMFLWGAQAPAFAFTTAARRERAACLTAQCAVEEVEGYSTPLLDALPRLAAISVADAARLPASIAVWSQAAKLALELVARGRIAPWVDGRQGEGEARWRASLSSPADAERFVRLAKSFPLAAHAVPREAGPRPQRARNTRARKAAQAHVWSPDALLETFLHASADVLVRAAAHEVAQPRRSARAPWEARLRSALTGRDAEFAPTGFTERTLEDELHNWARPLLGAQRGESRAAFRLDLPTAGEEPGGELFTLRFFLQASSDPSLLVPADEVFRATPSIRSVVPGGARAAQEALLAGLARAARIFPAINTALAEARPAQLRLKPGGAWQFLNEAAPQLIEAGFGVILPAELTPSGRRRLRMKMRIGAGARAAPRTAESATGGGMSLDEMLDFRWEAELAGETLSMKELRALADLKSPLVQFRGQWVAVDADEAAEALRLLSEREGTLAAHEALAAALGAAPRETTTALEVDVAVEGKFSTIVARLQHAAEQEQWAPPAGFAGKLRPYQERGVAWLANMASLELGACLADDMGLGKTIQLIAMQLHRWEQGAVGPALLVCPTSVVGNWERELARFAPSIHVVSHYGADRAREDAAYADLPPRSLVLTSYGLLRRDVEALGGVDWSTVALDEAQNIKNPASRTAQAARALRAQFRVALTGTPIENRLAELWSIFEFLNPRLLGSQAGFRREYAIPIERYGQSDVADRLRRLVHPFILRRLKSDPAVIQDLPPKQEMKVICSLTREQATLYQAALDQAMHGIETAAGIERRGQVLALLTSLKQICNHPAQYLRESGPLHGRSGKLQRLVEMLEETIAAGDRALVFTQYREMGERLVAELQRAFGFEALFLHGGVPRSRRDAMVRSFQEDERSAPVFVLSLKAGGAGLNLTAASHVFHFDRWWNPAVEDQATDRAYRIGQRRAVQVHKLLCAGTMEEKVDELLERKRELAASVIAGGESWITELGDDELRELFALSPDAVIAPTAADAE